MGVDGLGELSRVYTFDETLPFHHDVAVSRCLMASGIIENTCTRAVFAGAK